MHEFCPVELEVLKKEWLEEMKAQMAGNEKEMERNLEENDKHIQMGPGADNIIDSTGGPRSLTGGTRV